MDIDEKQRSIHEKQWHSPINEREDKGKGRFQKTSYRKGHFQDQILFVMEVFKTTRVCKGNFQKKVS